ncbi:hypothetical protein N7U66_03260 [Lacinutrix neustonica]|uniref:Uncharacterized protein n=1 Tax=Lacinutrix neustonica TaxID=2980107 RepID=A0A9E8SEV7_9FLAO|nr:hypothetical protein [Lacinutrix neustonica]WAC02704.1 hypothetical protein N7U66_03260 [Lacinutrix neustonica]
MFFAANKRSFTITKQAYTQIGELKEKLNYVNASTGNIGQLERELKLYDRIIGIQGMEPEIVQQSILNFTTSFEKVGIFGMEEIHVAESDGFSIITNQLILEGDYNSLIEIIYEFEKEFESSNIVSIAFSKEKEYRDPKK